MTVLDIQFTEKWDIKQGVTPKSQFLEPLDKTLNITLEEE